MFFIGQNLTYSFLEPLMFFWLTLHCLEFISDHAKEILLVNKYKLHGKPIMKQKQTFSLVSDIGKNRFLKKCKVKVSLRTYNFCYNLNCRGIITDHIWISSNYNSLLFPIIFGLHLSIISDLKLVWFYSRIIAEL